ncbi:MAG: 30S ribosomal protein S4 [Candidatus Diapherotrites archaeon]|nr:30S ribosomal protein S4 [Candidatus Diapherotrites archaeon]
MGGIKKAGKKYQRPQKPWDKTRIEEERVVTDEYGLKNKKEIWRAQTFIRNKRQIARKLLASKLEIREKREKELLGKLIKLGILRENAILEDVFTLTGKDLLERRLQTLVWRQGLANTIKQARQFIVHGKISVSGRKMTIPGTIVEKSQDSMLGYYGEPPQLEIKETQRLVTKDTDKLQDLEKEFEEVKGETPLVDEVNENKSESEKVDE